MQNQNRSTPNRARQLALRVSLIYALAGAVWIVLSDRVLRLLIADARAITELQTYKGFAFVGVTALLLYAVLKRLVAGREREMIELEQASEKVRKLSYAVEQSPVSVVITDTTGKIEYVNRRFAEVTGYSQAEAMGQNPRILKSGELPDETYKQLWTTITGGGTWAGEFHNRKKNGELFWEWATISPIHDADGRITHFVAIKEDITERKHVAEALRTSEQRFRSLIENASDLITVVNNQGIIRFQSPSAERVLGYKPEELIGHNAFELVCPEDLPRAMSSLQRALSNPATPVSVECSLRHRNGDWRAMQVVGQSIPNQSSEGYVILNSRDVTESRKLEEQFRQVQKMEAVGRLAGGVAHDFNNILTVIQMQAGLLAAEHAAPSAQRENALEISRAAERAAALTRQLLLFSRRQAMQPRDLDLNDVITSIAKMLQRILGEDVRMLFKFSPRSLFVHADAGMLDQILMNLAVNSRDAMPKGGQLAVETSAVEFDENVTAHSPQARPGSFACLSVSDTGSGIAPEHLPRIFEPFFTTKDVGHGTGLGLATVFGIVQQHQGWINVYSEVGRGTTFRIYLPRLNRAENLKPAHSTLNSIAGGHETILLAEDEPSLRNLVRATLSRLGYRVLEASTGVAALELWRQHRTDVHLLFTDMVMPDGLSGMDLAQQLLQEKPELKVIYTSGYSAEIVKRHFPVQEGVNFLAKPFEAFKLAQTVRKRLDET